MKGIQVIGRSALDIERAAAQVHGLIMPGAEPTDPLDGIELFEYALEEHGHALTSGTQVVYGVERLPASIEGHTQFDPRRGSFQVTLSERSYKALVRGETRPLFTLCHEVGHLSLHTTRLKRLKQLPHRELMMERSRDQHPVYEDSEWQANRFASALMMPAHGLEQLRRRGRLNEDDIADQFHTSYTAAGLRLKEFNQKRSQLLTAWK